MRRMHATEYLSTHCTALYTLFAIWTVAGILQVGRMLPRPVGWPYPTGSRFDELQRHVEEADGSIHRLSDQSNPLLPRIVDYQLLSGCGSGEEPRPTVRCSPFASFPYSPAAV